MTLYLIITTVFIHSIVFKKLVLFLWHSILETFREQSKHSAVTRSALLLTFV